MNWKNIRKIFYVMMPVAFVLAGVFAYYEIGYLLSFFISFSIGMAGTYFLIKKFNWLPYD